MTGKFIILSIRNWNNLRISFQMHKLSRVCHLMLPLLLQRFDLTLAYAAAELSHVLSCNNHNFQPHLPGHTHPLKLPSRAERAIIKEAAKRAMATLEELHRSTAQVKESTDRTSELCTPQFWVLWSNCRGNTFKKQNILLFCSFFNKPCWQSKRS